VKIYSMTATFGKLEHTTLELKPGLNVIEAPNEWGKSTWCAFLVNMLYGIDTREKTTKTTLAEKERYAPWSGAPMAGRIDLNWNGRDITIERSTKGRVPFGDFRAYETETGIDIPELNSTNCGQTLLGVERSVFTRAGFLKLSDLPLTQDDALRRRLNALVTTGDESGAGDKLGQKLKDLKNKCRYNRSGLLPQAEAQRDQLEQQIYDLQDLNKQIESTSQRQQELDGWVSKLENHKATLAYTRALEDASQVEQAEESCAQAQQNAQQLELQCRQLPPLETAERCLQTVQTLQESWLSIQMETQMLLPAPEAPAAAERYAGMTPEAAVDGAKSDIALLERLKRKKKTSSVVSWSLMIAAVLIAAGAVVAMRFVPNGLFIGLCCGSGALLIAGAVMLAAGTVRLNKQIKLLLGRYGALEPANWVNDAESYAAGQRKYAEDLQRHQAVFADLDKRRQALDAKTNAFTEGKTLGAAQEQWNQAVTLWHALADAQRGLRQAENHLKALRSMAKTAQKPQMPDDLAHTKEETDAMLTNALLEQKQNSLRMGQLQGQAEALGQESALRQQLKAVKHRIAQLEDYYRALELAQNALYAATSELQRRFAPRITKRTQALFGKLTGGRYNRLILSEDLSLSVGAELEDTLRDSQWRSDGTVDQLYLALRLAVAEELTPEAPLILDDALVRFDDKRLAAAMDILKETAQSKQVIVFTCQNREKTHA